MARKKVAPAEEEQGEEEETVATKPAPKKKATALNEAMSKTQLLAELAENTGLTTQQISSVLDELRVVIARHIRKRGVGKFTLPGLFKIQTIKKPAREAQQGVPDPSTPGETMDVAAKPASVKVKVTPLKKLKKLVK